jgi:hypothetical protein
MGGPAGSGEESGEARLQLLVAEYTWVSGLIRYYREVELKALAGTGLVLSGVGAAVAALRASDNDEAVNATGLVLAIAAAIITFILPVVLMANMRGMRAVVYVREWLHPLAAELARDARCLAWEAVSGGLFDALAGRLGTRLKPMLSAAVVVTLIGTTSLALAAAAWTVEHSPWSRAIASVAAAFDLVLMFTTYRFAKVSELRRPVPAESLSELEARASLFARFPPAS